LERLLEFVFGNFYFFILLIGLIYAMFFRKSPLEKPENRSGRQVPDRRPHGRPHRRPGDSYPPHLPGGGFPAGRPSGRMEGPFAPGERMPDFGGPPRFPLEPPRRPAAGPVILDDEEARPLPAGPARPRPVLWEPDEDPRTEMPIPVPAQPRPERPSAAEGPGSGEQPHPEPAWEAEDGLFKQGTFASDSDTVPKANAAGAPETKRAASFSLPRDELARAFVWSEILGPPRARRPFRR